MLSQSEINEYYKNRGVARNKRPLRNIVYSVKVGKISDEADKKEYEKYKFKDKGYLTLTWWHHSKPDFIYKSWYGPIEPERLKKVLGEKQWSKFCQGKREFIVQRRFDGKNRVKKQRGDK